MSPRSKIDEDDRLSRSVESLREAQGFADLVRAGNSIAAASRKFAEVASKPCGDADRSDRERQNRARNRDREAASSRANRDVEEGRMNYDAVARLTADISKVKNSIAQMEKHQSASRRGNLLSHA